MAKIKRINQSFLPPMEHRHIPGKEEADRQVLLDKGKKDRELFKKMSKEEQLAYMRKNHIDKLLISCGYEKEEEIPMLMRNIIDRWLDHERNVIIKIQKTETKINFSRNPSILYINCFNNIIKRLFINNNITSEEYWILYQGIIDSITLKEHEQKQCTGPFSRHPETNII